MRCTLAFLFSRAIIIIVSIVLATNSANAQFRRGKPSPGGMLGILLNPKVQNDIGIQNDTERLEKLSCLGDVIVKERQELRQATKADQDQYMEEAFRNIELKYRDDIKQVLTVEQYKRLQQITWQQLHYGVLTDPDVVEAMELTSEQIKKISSAQRENATQQKDYFGKIQRVEPKPPIDEVRRALDEINAAYHQKIGEILSKSQQDKFVEMQGKPFK